MEESSLKHRTARSLKWNVIDRVSSQVLYAVTGIVLARELTQEAFGLVGAIMVFQAFAMLMVDGGFSSALIQRKNPTETDYSSIFWFNMLAAVTIYVILWFCAPMIADCFGGDPRLIPLGRVMFLSFIIMATSNVQINRLIKLMNVRPLAMANLAALTAGGIVGISMAVNGQGAWALVWQSITVCAVKSLILWVYCRWIPRRVMSVKSLRGFFKVGSGMMMTSFLNTLFQNIYSFFIGNRVGLVPLGYYSQADKWSKMGVTSVTQVLSSSFLPALSEVQDDRERFFRASVKMSRFTAYLLFPAIGFLIVMATPIFHVLFGQRWDASIILFQLLLTRGIFTVLNSLYNNFLLALGHSRPIFRLEVLRDAAALAGIGVTLPMIALSTPDNVVAGLTIFLSGQVIASLITWIATIAVTVRKTRLPLISFFSTLFPYFVTTVVIMSVLYGLSLTGLDDVTLLVTDAIAGVGLYMLVNRFIPGRIQSEVISYVFRRGESHSRDNRTGH